MKADLSSVGKRVAYARKFRGLTQHELAAKANIAQSSLATLEAGRIQSSRSLVQIAMALNVPAEWLANGGDSSTFQEVLLETPAWSASEAEKTVHRILSSAVLGEHAVFGSQSSSSSGEIPNSGLKLLAWRPNALRNPSAAEGVDLEQHRRFACPYKHSPEAFFLRVPSDFIMPQFRCDDLILVDPNVPPEQGNSVVVLHHDESITLGRLESCGNQKFNVVLEERSTQVLYEITDRCLIVGTIIARLQRFA